MGAPDCAGIWKGGGELPKSYDGCNSAAGFVASDKLGCSSGQRMVRYDDSFFAVAGGSIYETSGPLEKDKLYLQKVRTCRG